MMKCLKRFVCLMLTVLLSLGALASAEEMAVDAEMVGTDAEVAQAAATGNQLAGLMFTATVEPARELAVKAPASGELEPFTLKAGDVLAAGDTLFAIRGRAVYCPIAGGHCRRSDVRVVDKRAGFQRVSGPLAGVETEGSVCPVGTCAKRKTTRSRQPKRV